MAGGDDAGGGQRWLIRLAWFVALWLAGVGALAIVAFAIRGVVL
jgi:hypothetical protein